MSLAPGTRFGPIEILSQLGSGGMGEVYRGTDTRLGRTVAIKVLPEVFALDPERLARFEREAKLLAALNHPNIAAIYGLERSGGTHCLVMELVEGEDLARRVARGPIGHAEAAEILLQIAEALEEAHEKGIIHRDLKPSNVMATPEERVKVLDFGLAKALDADATGESSEISRSPTLTGAMTAANVILGTAAYMSPEQARGRRVDKRADIWAFGCVGFELLTGRRTFDGETVSDTLASVLKQAPEWEALPPDVPARLRALLSRCLEKDPKRRLRDIGEARLVLQGIRAGEPDPAEARAAEPVPSRPRVNPIAVLAALALAAGTGVLGWALKPAPRPETAWSDLLPPSGAAFALGTGGHFALAPDGRRLAFAAEDSTRAVRLWIRDLSSGGNRALTGTEGATYPFWSADGRAIGFFSGGKLRRIDADGGAALTLADAPDGRGGAWSADGVILFSPVAGGGLFAVSAAGGDTRPILAPDSSVASYRWPHFLPDGERFLFCDLEDTLAVHVGTLSGEREPALALGRSFLGNVTFADGRLYFVQEGALRARPFDPRRLTFTGDAVTIASPVGWHGGRAKAQVSVAGGGTIAFLPVALGEGAVVAAYDRSGARVGLVRSPQSIEDLTMSRDGRQFALCRLDQSASGIDVWTYDYARGVFARLTFSGDSDDPVWSPDGSRIAWARGGDICLKSSSGAGEEESLLVSDDDEVPLQWSPDGRSILYVRVTVAPDQLWLLDVASRETRALRTSEQFFYNHAQFSQDGRWLAYTSNESGEAEVYVQDFPAMRGRWQVSTQGGAGPRWKADGTEIYYLDAKGRMVAVEVASRDASLVLGESTVLFETLAGGFGSRNYIYDVDAQGTRFVVIEPEQSTATVEALTLVQNWRPAP